MSVYNSSSLVASELQHELPRDKYTGHVKSKGLFRHGKTHLTEKKMFGSRFGRHGKDFQIGKKFKSKKAKDTNLSMKGMGQKGKIGPSSEEFDDMMKESVTHNPNKKKSRISSKFFG